MKRIRSMLYYIIGIIIGVYLILCAYLYFNQRNIVFIPSSRIAMTPAAMNLPFEDLYLPVEKGVNINGWYVPSPDQSDKVVLFCHGNAGNISHRLETVWFLHSLGLNSLVFDYRGFGNSTGLPDENGVYADTRASYDWLIENKNFKAENIIIFGRSLGGAVAVDLAAKVPSGGLILESTFTSASDVARKIFSIFPIKLLIRFDFPAKEKIKSVKVPILITHSREDDIIPYAFGEKLFSLAPEPKQFFTFSGRHNDREYLKDPEYISAFKTFINGKSSRDE